MVRGVRGQLPGQAGQVLGNVGEVADPTARPTLLALSASPAAFATHSCPGPDRPPPPGGPPPRARTAAGTPDRTPERSPAGRDAVVPIGQAVLAAVRLERVGPGRVRQAGGGPVRLEDHTGCMFARQLSIGGAEDAEGPPVTAEMGGHRQAVRCCADDGDLDGGTTTSGLQGRAGIRRSWGERREPLLRRSARELAAVPGRYAEDRSHPAGNRQIRFRPE